MLKTFPDLWLSSCLLTPRLHLFTMMVCANCPSSSPIKPPPSMAFLNITPFSETEEWRTALPQTRRHFLQMCGCLVSGIRCYRDSTFFLQREAWCFAFHLSWLTESLGQFSGENSTAYQTSLTGFRSLPLTYTMTGMDPHRQGR